MLCRTTKHRARAGSRLGNSLNIAASLSRSNVYSGCKVQSSSRPSRLTANRRPPLVSISQRSKVKSSPASGPSTRGKLLFSTSNIQIFKTAANPSAIKPFDSSIKGNTRSDPFVNLSCTGALSIPKAALSSHVNVRLDRSPAFAYVRRVRRFSLSGSTRKFDVAVYFLVVALHP